MKHRCGFSDTQATRAASLDPGGIICVTGVTYFGRYELRALIGSGGMGEVYEALDREQNRLVALKLLPLAFMFDDGVVERFRQESFAAAQLNDPHVIPIHRYGDIDGRLYIDIPTAPTVTVLAKGAGAPITNGNVLSQYLAVTWTGESAGSTWPTAVTDGSSGTGPQELPVAAGGPFASLAGVPLGSRVLVQVPANSSSGQSSPSIAAAVDLIAQTSMSS